MPWIGAVVCLAYVSSSSSFSLSCRLTRYPLPIGYIILSSLHTGSDLRSSSACQVAVLRCPDQWLIVNRLCGRHTRCEFHPHRLPRESRQKHCHLCLGLLCEWDRPLCWSQGHASILWSLPGHLLARMHSNVCVWEALSVLREYPSPLPMSWYRVSMRRGTDLS